MKTCKDCNKAVITTKAIYCDECRDRRRRESQKEATERWRKQHGTKRDRGVKICSKCHEPKDNFYKGHSQCKDCYKAYVKEYQGSKTAEPAKEVSAPLPSDDLFYRLINRAIHANHKDIKKARQSTINRAMGMNDRVVI